MKTRPRCREGSKRAAQPSEKQQLSNIPTETAKLETNTSATTISLHPLEQSFIFTTDASKLRKTQEDGCDEVQMKPDDFRAVCVREGVEKSTAQSNQALIKKLHEALSARHQCQVLLS